MVPRGSEKELVSGAGTRQTSWIPQSLYLPSSPRTGWPGQAGQAGASQTLCLTAPPRSAVSPAGILAHFQLLDPPSCPLDLETRIHVPGLTGFPCLSQES